MQRPNPLDARRPRARGAGLGRRRCRLGGHRRSAPHWIADPEEQFLLDVNIRQLRLGDGVRAYQTPEGTCIVFGDFLTTLDLPMKIDLEAKKASRLGLQGGKSDRNRPGGRQPPATATSRNELADGTIRETPEGWCVETAALGRWFKLGVKPMTAGSVLLLESEAKLPVELAIEREKRAARIRPAAMPIRKSAEGPASLSHVARAGARFRRQRRRHLPGVDRHAGRSPRVGHRRRRNRPPVLRRAARRPTTRGSRRSLRVRAYRSDPDGGLLGPLNATHFAVGDVQGLSSRLVGGSTRPRRRSHQSAAVQPGRVRPHPVRRRPAVRLGRRALSQRRITCI